MSNETYTIAALASELGVPRTTVNDWLTRYSGFVESEMAGKRRLYSARTLEVLRLAASLRDAGKSAAEIENELAARFGIRPEVAAAPTAEPAEPSGNTGADTVEPAQLPALRKLEEHTIELSAFIAEMRIREARTARRNTLWFILMLLLAALLVIGGLLAWRMMSREAALRQQEAAALQEKMNAMQQSFADRMAAAEVAARTEREAAGKRHEALQKELEATRAANAAEVAMLQAEQKAEREQLEAARRRREEELAAQSTAARERMLREVQEGSRATEKRLQDEIAKARAEVQKLSSELERTNAKLKQPAPAPEVKPAVLTARPEAK